jgi:DNA-binding MarR family transcriptional regulator
MGPEEVEQLLLLADLMRGLKHSVTVGCASEPLKRDMLAAGLGERHGRLLVTLAATGPLSVGELAAKMGLAAPTVSLLVGEANRAGFLDRREDERDRRRTIVSLPERIQAPLERLARATVQPLGRTLEQLDPSARLHFLQGLGLLVSELDRVDRDAADSIPGSGTTL